MESIILARIVGEVSDDNSLNYAQEEDPSRVDVEGKRMGMRLTVYQPLHWNEDDARRLKDFRETSSGSLLRNLLCTICLIISRSSSCIDYSVVLS